jgi:fatty acid-binding protein DegV
MNAVALCTDSSALFPAGVAERLGIIVVPIAISLEGAPFDEAETPLDDFYTRVGEGARVTTSQPSPGEFLDAYTVAAETGSEEVISLHLDARISGTARSAELAARQAPIPVTVVDSKTVSFGVGLCVRAAARAIAGGASALQATGAARCVSSELRNVFVAHGGQSGRLPDEVGWSLLEFAEGAIEPRAACAGLDEAVEAMDGRVFEESGELRAAVGHADASTEAAADALALSLESQTHVVNVERYRVGAAVGAHTGPLSFGAFWWPSPPAGRRGYSRREATRSGSAAGQRTTENRAT